MKIGKALSEKKAAQNALARLINLRNSNLFYEKGKKPDFEFKVLEKDIEKQLKRIVDLKTRIVYTNCHTKLDNGMLLIEAIIKLGDIRSELQAYNNLLGQRTEPQEYYYRGNTKVKEKVLQIEKKEILKKIEILEKFEEL